MRKKEQEIKNPGILYKILTQEKVCRVAMMDGDVPYIVPLNYGYSDHVLFIHSAPDGKKIELIKKNPKVCFEIEDAIEIVQHESPCHWATTYRSIIGYGTIEILVDFQQKIKGLDIIMSHHGSPGPYHYEEKQINRMVILKLNIESMTGKQSGNWNQ